MSGPIPSASSSPPPLRQWQGRALVVGSGGIGRAVAAELARRAPGLELVLTGRSPVPAAPSDRATPIHQLPLDLTSDASLHGLQEALAGGAPLRLVFCAAGVLHGADLQPEKRLAQVRRSALEQAFAVNAFGPLLLAQALEPLLPRELPLHFASLSARVGSIGDNHLGGWFAYRGAKAAQNQLLRTLALEWRRRFPLACVSLLHPGTTATALSAPFQASVPPERLFSPERAAGHLLDVLEGLTPAQSGQFWAWDGRPIPW